MKLNQCEKCGVRYGSKVNHADECRGYVQIHELDGTITETTFANLYVGTNPDGKGV